MSTARMFHRLMMALGLARLTLVDDAGVIQRVQADFGPYDAAGASRNLRDNVPRLVEFGFTSNPPTGAEAVVVSLGGDPNQGVVIATGHREFRLVGLAGGDAALYDAHGHFVWLSEDGIRILGNVTLDGNLTVNGETLLNGNLTVTGDIVDLSESNATTVAEVRTAYNAHAHTGVTTGGGTSGITNTPT